MQAFPKIFAMGTRYIADILKEEVEVTEKVDGSQFGFGKIDGEVICRSKGKIQPLDNPDKMFKEAVEYVLSIEDKLAEGNFYYAEYLQKPMQPYVQTWVAIAINTTKKISIIRQGTMSTLICPF